MPLEFFRDKDGKKKSRYITPSESRRREQEREERRRTAEGSGGVGEDTNYVRRLFNVFGNAGTRLDKMVDQDQLERLKKFPDLQSPRFKNVQKNRRDAARNEGFDFDSLFSATLPDTVVRAPVEVRPSRGTTGDRRPELEKIRDEQIIGSDQPLTVGRSYTGDRTGGTNQVFGSTSPNTVGRSITGDRRMTQEEAMANRDAFTRGNIDLFFPGRNPVPVSAGTPLTPTVGGFSRNLIGLLNQNVGNFVPGANQFPVGIAPFGGSRGLGKGLDFFANQELRSAIAGTPLFIDESLPFSTRGSSINVGNFGQGFDIFGNPMTPQMQQQRVTDAFGFLQNLEDNERLLGYNLNIL